jgi:hypothetical protein
VNTVQLIKQHKKPHTHEQGRIKRIIAPK